MQQDAHVTVRYGKKEYPFVFKIHKSLTPHGQLIEAAFYEKWSVLQEVPIGLHYEIEIISPDVNTLANFNKIHYYQSSKNSKIFICWTGQIKSLADAKLILALWSQGTVYTIEKAESFDHLPKKHNISLFDFNAVITMFEKEYLITLPSRSFV